MCGLPNCGRNQSERCPMPDLTPIPCPWCRQTPVVGQNPEEFEKFCPKPKTLSGQGNASERAVDFGFRVECPCGACGPRRKFRSEAVTAWNKRRGCLSPFLKIKPKPERK